MEKQKPTNNHIITYDDFILDEWLSEMIDELLMKHPTFYEEINEVEEPKGE